MQTSSTKQKKPSLIEQLATKTAECEKLTIQLDETRKVVVEKQQEVTSVFNQKNKEMSDLLEALLRPMGMATPSSLYGTTSKHVRHDFKTKRAQLAGMVASGIAQLAEKNNLSQTIIQEQDNQITWFRETFEKVLGIKKPKVDNTSVEVPPKPPRRGSLT